MMKPGAITLTASASGLDSAEARIETIAPADRFGK